ncbi:uncharacterized protein [Hyperolius riggenbachi]|uniref:uncharacterized protein isoform X2 n=1 Tax=Hyperolius riggenbachi TaxID=752182 RepID=UPI0035A35E8C
MYGIIIIPGVSGAGIQQIPGQYGSDLHLSVPQLSNIGSDEGFYVYGAPGAGVDGRIGNYHGGFKGFGVYANRIQFTKETGTIVLKNFSAMDGLIFKVAVWKTKEELEFHVMIADPTTTVPAEPWKDSHAVHNTDPPKTEERNYTGNNTCTTALISVGLSVDPPICLLAIWLVMKLMEKLQKNTEDKSCPHRARLFLLGNNSSDYIKLGRLINNMISLGFQVVSMISLVLCEWTWWLIGTGLCTVFLAVVWIYRACHSSQPSSPASSPASPAHITSRPASPASPPASPAHMTSRPASPASLPASPAHMTSRPASTTSPSGNGGMRSDIESSWCSVLWFLEWMTSLVFPACVFFWYCFTYGNRELLWVAPVSCVLSFIVKFAVFILCRLRGTTTNSSYSDNKGSPQPNSDDPSPSDILLQEHKTQAV